MIKLLAAAAMLAGQTPARPPEQCVPRQRISDLIVVIAPYFIDSARTRCQSHLPSSSYLRQPAAAQLSERMRTEGTHRRASAVAAIRAIGRTPATGVSDDTLINLMGEGTAGMAMAEPSPGGCRDLSTIIESMSAMSTEQVGRFFAAIMGMTGRSRSTMNPQICDELE
jgi:hypothetical protein